MKKNDFFISYAKEDTDKIIKIVQSLENKGLKCWYAPRDVIGRYAKAIVEAIEQSKVFLVCLSKHSAVSEHVLNEVEMVYNKMRMPGGNIIIEPLCLENIDMDAPEFDEMMYYIRRINFITPNDFTAASMADEVFNRNRTVLNLNAGIKKDRNSISYIDSADEEERLRLQNELLREFDSDIYKDVFDRLDNPSILDLGCGIGQVLFDRLRNSACPFKYIGVERDENRIAEARHLHPEKDTFFLQADVETEDFFDDLMDLMDKTNIRGFDVIHISMFLLYLKNLGKLFRRLKRLLNDDGVIFIKDVDDGINFAYPDDGGTFDRIYKMCARIPNSGDRLNGRQIPHHLIKAGFGQIDLVRQGLNTFNMTKDQRDVLFNMYFKPILSGSKELCEQYPQNEDFCEDYSWYNSNYEDIHKRFLDDEFVFSLGIQIYVARKEKLHAV